MPTAASQQHLLANVRALLHGTSLPHSGFDSDDDQTSLVGKRIRCVSGSGRVSAEARHLTSLPSRRVRWAGERYYRGTITDWCETTARHHVVYDDGDERWYELSLKTWRFDPE